MAHHGLRAIRDIEHRFWELLESAPDAIFEFDGDGRIVLLNRMAEQLFGYVREELLGQPVEVLVPEVLREVHKTIVPATSRIR
jgi:PAS domain S-box-containing protein